ncbi:MAG: hypothetical protein A2908_02835 [Candidatus Staskawiczbacteria bacterium RIFCSPLOWO2_01_FULL_38_12b]|uniref:UDP-N-acetylmuramoyl-L-alanyl-D-glutamate--2, 6-diaminopimelate ligase n=1 Tax=Candidatus Staskawiczbacteria bacterium RIFCSPLOWO2_01_FULL_38_12b TaxID=1802214 RepID=A0A1G2ICL7_9BACT|nr:MAG: hypothetical protein A2908_02835 [Candidatus Staskawiczbacteria bacterium RIFCSPLOWO2_01_FULL_38_12b]
MKIKSFIKKLTPDFLLDFYYWLWALAGAIAFGFPSRKLIVIGVTGTSGKSTTIDFITRILEEAGNHVASASSIRFKIKNKEWQNTLKMTMPGRFVIQKFLRQAVQSKCNYAVLEVTSEGIKQYRHKFITFDTAVFLNITPEHIDSHGGFENYRSAKLELFKAAKNLHVINADDENTTYFLEIPAKKKYLFGIKNSNVDLCAEKIRFENGKITFWVSGTEFHLGLLGEFNVLNAMAAISLGMAKGISLDICKKALGKVTGMPGRLEVVAENPFLVVVDYAFTPEQLDASYKSVKQFSGGKPLVCVLGACGGGRDKWKRPVLGKIAQQHCKEIIITNEDPYDEDPLGIMEQVADGIDNQVKPYHIILDRKEAIKRALALAGQTDAVVITGKGAEPLMCLANGKKIPWSDKNIVKEELDHIDSSLPKNYN